MIQFSRRRRREKQDSAQRRGIGIRDDGLEMCRCFALLLVEVWLLDLLVHDHAININLMHVMSYLMASEGKVWFSSVCVLMPALLTTDG